MQNLEIKLPYNTARSSVQSDGEFKWLFNSITEHNKFGSTFTSNFTKYGQHKPINIQPFKYFQHHRYRERKIFPNSLNLGHQSSDTTFPGTHYKENAITQITCVYVKGFVKN